MVAARWRRRRRRGGGRNYRRGSVMKWTWQSVTAAVLAAVLGQPAVAQSLAQNAPRPAATKPERGKPAAQQPTAAAPAKSERPPDLAYGAFQRGYFLTAFGLATDRV